MLDCHLWWFDRNAHPSPAQSGKTFINFVCFFVISFNSISCTSLFQCVKNQEQEQSFHTFFSELQFQSINQSSIPWQKGKSLKIVIIIMFTASRSRVLLTRTRMCNLVTTCAISATNISSLLILFLMKVVACIFSGSLLIFCTYY